MGLHFIGVEDLGEIFNFNQLIVCHPIPLVIVVVSHQLSVIRGRAHLIADMLLKSVRQLLEANAIDVVVARHVRQDDGVAFIQSFYYLDLINRGTADFHLNANRALVVRRFLEKAER